MHCAGDEFLAGAGFAVNEHGGTCRGDGLDLFEDAAERAAFPDNFSEVVLGASLFLKIGLLLRKLVLQCRDFLKRQGVVDSHGNLVCNEPQEVKICGIVC